MINKEFLSAKSAEMGIELNDAQLSKLDDYAKFLVSYNEKVNLTAITDPEGIAIKHFVDSMVLDRLFDIRKGATIADVGTGAGFPSVPLKVIRPDTQITMIDSLGKRITFLKELSKLLDQNNKAVHLRAEQAGIDVNLREQFDIATARAVAELRVLCEYCLPLVKVGGYMLAMKGPSGNDELENAANAIEILGGGNARIIDYTLPDGSTRSLVIIEKIAETPKKYPRQRVKLNEKPL